MTDRTNFIQTRRSLFWSVSEKGLPRISDELLVETIFNFGTEDDVRALFALLGIEKTASIFRNTTQGRTRHNYLPVVANFFRLYFDRHVPSHPLERAA